MPPIFSGFPPVLLLDSSAVDEKAREPGQRFFGLYGVRIDICTSREHLSPASAIVNKEEAYTTERSVRL